jgi:hypothetical protein
MLMKNTASHPIKIDAEMLEEGSCKGEALIPVGAIVKIKNSYACRSRSLGGAGANIAIPSRASRLTGDALQPYGPEAREMYENKFVDQLPEVILKLAKDAVRDENGVSAVPDPREAQRKLDEEIGRRMRMAVDLSKSPDPVPKLYSPEELPDIN